MNKENVAMATKQYTITCALFLIISLMPAPFFAGEIAPRFSLADVQGSAVDLEQYRGKVVFLAFWADWCVPCREELPALETLYKKYRNIGFEVIAVSIRTSESQVCGFLRKTPVSFPVLVDKNSDISDAYGISRVPESVLIDRDGVIRFRHKGFGEEFLAVYEEEIRVLLKQ